jgi:hypothetical protein
MSVPRRRHDDRGWKSVIIRENAYRDVWLLLISGFLLLALVRSQDAIDRQIEGRRIGSSITCSVISSVIEAGRDQILSSATPGPPNFEANLRKLGYPPIKVRREAAQAAAHQYASRIAWRVKEASGLRGIIRKDGTLNCPNLQKAVKVKSR